MKRKILFFISGIAAFALLTAGTYSFRSGYATAENVIRTGNVDFVIHQTDENGDSITGLTEGILPGDTVKRQVTFENTGNGPVYLRARLQINTANEEKEAEKCLELDINSEKWTYRDGYYYYCSELSPGETTEPLFSAVRFIGEEIDNSFISEKIGLNIIADAVQSENNGDGVFEVSEW